MINISIKKIFETHSSISIIISNYINCIIFHLSNKRLFHTYLNFAHKSQPFF